MTKRLIFSLYKHINGIEMEQIRDIIELWPTITDLADDINVPETNIRKWRERGSIPANKILKVVDSAFTRRIMGVTPERILRAIQ